MTEGFDVFLSYNSQDEAFVLKLKSALDARGLKVWRDREEIRPGDLFVLALERGLEASRTVALIASANALSSGWLQEEYSRALNLCQLADGARLIPILLPGAELPGFLANRNYVDFRDERAFNDGVDALVWGIRGERPLPSRPSKRLALLDRRLAAELLVAFPAGGRSRRVDAASLVVIAYALGSFDRVLVENQFGSVLHTLLLREEGALRDIVLTIPLEGSAVESEQGDPLIESWAADPGFQISAARYASSKGNASESVRHACIYLHSSLALARRYDATIVAHPQRAPLYRYWFEHCEELSGRAPAEPSVLLPSPADCLVSADRGRRIERLLQAWSKAAHPGRIDRYPPLTIPTPRSAVGMRGAAPRKAMTPFAYELLSVVPESAA